MRIFVKKSFQFNHPTEAVDAVKVQLESFADVPDWVEDSAMFKLASQDGDVLVIESKQDELAAETGADAKAAKAAEAKAKKEAE